MATATQGDVSFKFSNSIRPGSTLHEPIRRDACVSWWDDFEEGDEFDALDTDGTVDFSASIPLPQTRHRFALLLDIGLSGASMLVDDLPEDDQVIWFRLAGDRPGEWAEADIVEAMTTTLGPHVLRLAFRDACPFAILREAVCG